MNARGFTLIESVVALGLLSIVLAGMLPAYQTLLDANTLSEQRSNALAAAQEVMEVLRQQDPASLPDSGSSSPEAIEIGEHGYEVVAHFCQVPEYCNDASRHIIVEVSFGGTTVYTLESVFTRLH